MPITFYFISCSTKLTSLLSDITGIRELKYRSEVKYISKIDARIKYALTKQPELDNNTTLGPSLIFSLHLDSINADDLKAKSNAISFSYYSSFQL